MDLLTAQDPETRSADLVAANLAQLKTLFPEAFTAGKIDFDTLRQLLGDAVADGEEKYGLNWRGKRQARRLSLTTSAGTLRPCPDESVAWRTTQNLMLEGDNLEVLKLLQKSYSGKVKLIYIDPPYNTGNDYIYPDNYRDGVKNYLTITGQVDGRGQKLTTNTDASGRFHTNWLNMMYPRLKLARNLLKEDGIIFVSIDDVEIHNLRDICDEIFGYENFCGTFVWEKKKKPSFLDSNMGTVTDYILAYAKNRLHSPAFKSGTVELGKKYPFNNAGNSLSVLEFPAQSVTFRIPDQIVKAQDMSAGNIKTELLDDVRIENNTNFGSFRLRGEWRYSQSKLDEFVSTGSEISISKVPFRPNYINTSGESKKTSNLLSYRVNNVQTNEDATMRAREIFGNDIVQYPKPEGLLKYLIRTVSADDDLCLDFFAGSGTFASSIWQQNSEDLLKRRFIVVQLPLTLDVDNKEQKEAARFCYRIGQPANLAELTKEWLRRSANTIKNENPTYDGDLGFRVFKLDSSNIRPWDPHPEDLEQALLDHIDRIKPDRSEADIFYELLLKLGIDLCAPVARREIAGKQVYSAAGGALLACLAPQISQEEGETLALGIAQWRESLENAADGMILFRDNAFANDVAKTNTAEILRQHGAKNIRSL